MRSLLTYAPPSMLARLAADLLGSLPAYAQLSSGGHHSRARRQSRHQCHRALTPRTRSALLPHGVEHLTEGQQAKINNRQNYRSIRRPAKASSVLPAFVTALETLYKAVAFFQYQLSRAS